MNLKIWFLLIICIIYTRLYSQDNFIHFDKINFINRDSNIVSYDFIYSSGPQGILDNTTGRGILKHVESDTLNFHHNIWFQNEYGIFQQIYDGKQIAFFEHGEAEYKYIDLKKLKQGYRYIEGNIVRSLRPVFLFDTSYYNFLKDTNDVESLDFDTINLFGKKVYQLKVKFADGDFMQNNFSSYYFDYQTFMPIGYKYLFEIGGSKLEQSFFIFNIIISGQKNADIFNYKIYDDFGYLKTDLSIKTEKSEKPIAIKNDTILSPAFDFEKYRGKVLVLDFWYIGCAPCLKLIPVMEKLYEEYPDVAFIGMNVSDKPDKIKKFIEKRGIKYPVSPDDSGLSKKYEMKGYPVVIVFDKSGNLIKRFDGYCDAIYDQIKSVIEVEINK